MQRKVRHTETVPFLRSIPLNDIICICVVRNGAGGDGEGGLWEAGVLPLALTGGGIGEELLTRGTHLQPREAAALLSRPAKCEINKKEWRMAALWAVPLLPCSLLKPYLYCSIAPSYIKSH